MIVCGDLMIRVLLIQGQGSQTLVHDLTGRMEVDLVQSSSVQGGQIQAAKGSFDIILAPGPGSYECLELAYLPALLTWNQSVRSSGTSTVFLLYSPAGESLVITDISAGIVPVEPGPESVRTLISAFRQASSRGRLERSFRTGYDLQSRVIASMPLAYLSLENGLIVGCNPACEQLSGRSSESLIGSPFSDLIRAEEDPGVRYGAILHTSHEGTIPVRIHHPLGSDSGNFQSGMLFLEDRREPEQLTASLRDTERECREKLWLSETLVLKFAPDGIITFANNATLRCFGYTELGLLGNHISLLLPSGLDPQASPLSLFLGVANESEPTAIHIMEHLRSNGGKIYIAWTTKAYYTSSGELTGLLCIGTDMTDQTPEGEGRISTRIWRDRVIDGTDVLPEVFDAILQACIEIAREGREGKPVGTAFLVGDREAVMARSRQLILNPFYGHPAEMRTIIKKDVREMLKEYALLDGAFVVSGDGMLEAAGRYITVDASEASLPKGMGTRHSSTAAITTVTRTVGLVVSESGGRVSVIKDGKIVKVIG
ncbi:MAG: diadenylate cyclase [Methanospirillum sp.]|uniref:diadenylate cyclase n=1 Tax=Methanospirillum sp. TaxID=45200 RepID=UPI002371C4B7|nr:diadenylate cyclase [Methanospirillum sp.]MDD1729665.1 diadenylate cyclase [Methanospirillum sp.]